MLPAGEPHSIFLLMLRSLRAPLTILLLAYSISIAGFVIIPGTLADGTPWRMDFFHAFYFVSYMGSTIGFGELPHPFNGAQRLWTLFCIYATVISWLYAIGTLIAVFQNKEFMLALSRDRNQSKIRNLKEPFYLLCGYGDAGRVAFRSLGEVGLRTVVIDREIKVIDTIALDNSPLETVAICADAADPEDLKRCGLTHPKCRGVISVIGNDLENLKIAISSKLLNPALPVIGRVESDDTASNMKSFGTDTIVNPFRTFAWHFGLAFSKPALYLLNSWLSQTDQQSLKSLIDPPRGHWIVCGYGRFGAAVSRILKKNNNTVTIIDTDISAIPDEETSLHGRGTEARTLRQAGIQDSVGIIAGTDNDTNNLSILITAKDLKPDLFTVGRQNKSRNESLFDAIKLNVRFNHTALISNQLVALLTTPLTNRFLKLAEKESEEWANALTHRIQDVVDDKAPTTWSIELNNHQAPAFWELSSGHKQVKLEHLLRATHDRKTFIPCIPLLLIRDNDAIMDPDPNFILQNNDQILFCGQSAAMKSIHAVLQFNSSLTYVRTGKHTTNNPIWKWIEKQFSRDKNTNPPV